MRHRNSLVDVWNLESFSGGSDGKESACNAGDLGLIPGSGRSSGEETGHPLKYSCLENSTDRGAYKSTHPWGRRESDTAERLTQRLWAAPCKILPCDSVSLPWETSCVQGNWRFRCAHLCSFSEAGNCQPIKGDVCHPAAEQGSTITRFIWGFLTVQASFQKFSVEFSWQK